MSNYSKLEKVFLQEICGNFLLIVLFLGRRDWDEKFDSLIHKTNTYIHREEHYFSAASKHNYVNVCLKLLVITHLQVGIIFSMTLGDTIEDYNRIFANMI